MAEIEEKSENADLPFAARDSGGKFLPGGPSPQLIYRHGYWSPAVKRQEFRKSIKTLIDIRDGRLHELTFSKDGKKRMVAKAKIDQVIKACELLLGYAAGKPATKIDLSVAGGVEAINTLQIVLHDDVRAAPANADKSPLPVIDVTPENADDDGKG